MAFSFSKYFSFLKTKKDVGKNREVIGIDLGSSSLKVVQLKQVDDTVTLVTYGELQLGPYADRSIGSVTDLSEQKISEALVDVIRESSATGTSGMLAIPYSSSFMTVIKLTVDSEEEIVARIPVEAKKYIPVPLKEVTLDWFLISTIKQGRKIQQRILLAAIHNEALTKYRNIMNAVNMGTSPSEIEVFSAVRSSMVPEDEHVAIIDLGASASRMYVVESGVVHRTYGTKIGGSQLTETIMESHDMSFEDAEMLKRTDGLQMKNDKTKTVRLAIEPKLRKITLEMKHVLQKHETKYQTKIEKIILTGGGAEMFGISSLMTDAFSVETVIADPFAKVAYPAFMEDVLKNAGPSFTVAIGVALRALE